MIKRLQSIVQLIIDGGMKKYAKMQMKKFINASTAL